MERLEAKRIKGCVYYYYSTWARKDGVGPQGRALPASLIIRAYRSQFLIEAVFKVMKDRGAGTWWPLNHWTDRKIQVHALYCTIGFLRRGLMHRRVQRAGVQISLPAHRWPSAPSPPHRSRWSLRAGYVTASGLRSAAITGRGKGANRLSPGRRSTACPPVSMNDSVTGSNCRHLPGAGGTKVPQTAQFA